MKKTSMGFALILIAGIIGILSNFIGFLITPQTTFQLNPVTAITITLSALLIVSAELIRSIKSVKIFPWASLVISILLVFSIYEWLPAVLGTIGSILPIKQK